MPSSVDGDESQGTRTPRETGLLASNFPLPQRLCRKLILPGPLERKRHPLVAHLRHPESVRVAGRTSVTHPVARPVVRADVYEHAHAALEQCADVQLGGEDVIELRLEARVDLHAAHREVAARGVDADRLADVRAIEEGRHFPENW